MIKQLLLLVAVLSMSTVIMQQESVYAQQATVANTLTIDADCGLDVASSMGFDNANAGSISFERTLLIENTGNLVADIEMYATDWTDDLNVTTIVINGEKTAFAPEDIGSGDYSTKTSSNSTDTYIPMGTVAAGYVNSTYWEVETELVSGQESFAGSISQTLTIVMGC